MPQSLSSVYVHLVFSTKDRRAYLQDQQLREEMPKAFKFFKLYR